MFIEKSPSRFEELRTLKEQFKAISDRIILEQGDCNECLQRICRDWDWRKRRAVLFLDPYGMQVDWSTMEAIASTKAIDTWILFPLGVAVNRLLTRNGNIPETWNARLDRMFGTNGWSEEFYRTSSTEGLFGEISSKRKTGNFESISRYYNGRLQGLFAGVADSPLRLCNSTGNPLFLFCFAAANPKGAPIAKRIAEHIIMKKM